MSVCIKYKGVVQNTALTTAKTIVNLRPKILSTGTVCFVCCSEDRTRHTCSLNEKYVKTVELLVKDTDGCQSPSTHRYQSPVNSTGGESCGQSTLGTECTDVRFFRVCKAVPLPECSTVTPSCNCRFGPQCL